MKKSVSTIFSLLVFLFAIGFCFFKGYLSLHVSQDECAVLSSKTSGIYPKAILSDTFVWRWEALIPKNISLLKTSMGSQRFTFDLKGELPSASVYRQFVKESEDFTYSCSVDVELAVIPQEFVKLFEEKRVFSKEQFENLMKEDANRIANDVLAFFLDPINSYNGVFNLSSDYIKDACSVKKKYPSYSVSSIFVRDLKIPDMNLYKMAKDSYQEYNNSLNEALKKEALEQAKIIVNNNNSLNKLEKFAQILKDYPEILSLFQSEDVSSVMQKIDSFR